ncbi:MAG: sugar transferase [Tannerellaceae bacterium]|jgi:lipopolysaccharide/colanic/teichoic acid biosynthesis glycosyltransferase|nr:sugar transferase [Tannerellaceae bacterium]
MSLNSILLLVGTEAKATAAFERLRDVSPPAHFDKEHIFQDWIKFSLDKGIAFLAIILFSPLLLYIAVRIRFTTSESSIFRQERLGYHGKPFMIYKFRTMYADAEVDGQPLLSTADDPRITPFGAFLRKYRLDELPQFWNVLKGDMSLVGPRPERRYFTSRIAEEVPAYYLLHNLRPGITSLGMVKYGYASDVPQMLERLKYDLLYYENRNLLLDIAILFCTLHTVATGKGI